MSKTTGVGMKRTSLHPTSPSTGKSSPQKESDTADMQQEKDSSNQSPPPRRITRSKVAPRNLENDVNKDKIIPNSEGGPVIEPSASKNVKPSADSEDQFADVSLASKKARLQANPEGKPADNSPVSKKARLSASKESKLTASSEDLLADDNSVSKKARLSVSKEAKLTTSSGDLLAEDTSVSKKTILSANSDGKPADNSPVSKKAKLSSGGEDMALEDNSNSVKAKVITNSEGVGESTESNTSEILPNSGPVDKEESLASVLGPQKHPELKIQDEKQTLQNIDPNTLVEETPKVSEHSKCENGNASEHISPTKGNTAADEQMETKEDEVQMVISIANDQPRKRLMLDTITKLVPCPPPRVSRLKTLVIPKISSPVIPKQKPLNKNGPKQPSPKQQTVDQIVLTDSEDDVSKPSNSVNVKSSLNTETQASSSLKSASVPDVHPKGGSLLKLMSKTCSTQTDFKDVIKKPFILSILNSDDKLKLVSGIPTFNVLESLADATLKMVTHSKAMQTVMEPTLREWIIMTCTKFMLNVDCDTLAVLFQVTESDCTRIVEKTCQFLRKTLSLPVCQVHVPVIPMSVLNGIADVSDEHVKRK